MLTMTQLTGPTWVVLISWQINAKGLQCLNAASSGIFRPKHEQHLHKGLSYHILKTNSVLSGKVSHLANCDDQDALSTGNFEA